MVTVPPDIGRLHQLRMCVLEGEGSGGYCIRALSQLQALTALHLNAMALNGIPDWYKWVDILNTMCTCIVHAGCRD